MQSTNPASRLYNRPQNRCQECVKAAARKWRGENPELIRDRQVGYRLKFHHGIERGDYDRILAEQGGGCAICGATAAGRWGTLHVDHDHTTGALRGILCHRCNTALGLFGEDPGLMDRAADYLEATA